MEETSQGRKPGLRPWLPEDFQSEIKNWQDFSGLVNLVFTPESNPAIFYK